MTILYIASDERGAGKTAVAAGLASLLNGRGVRAAAVKPFAGEDELAGAPEPKAFEGNGTSKAKWPVALGAGGLTDDALKKASSLVKGLAKDHQVVLVEGSNALSAEEGHRLAGALDAKVLAVVRHRHGMAAASLAHWKVTHGERFLGVLFNQRGKYLATEVATSLIPALAAEEMASFGAVPEDRTLLAVTVGQIADHLGGRLLTEENDMDALVQHFLIGGWTLDEGRLYFETRQDKAVVMKGNRPDLQMAALSTPTAAMVCTGGLEPIEYVKYEAQETGAALMVVNTGTIATMEALNTIQDGVRFDHPAKVARFAGLLGEHADVDGLLAALGVKAG